MAGICASCARHGRRAMERKRRSASFWEAKRSLMRSVKNAPKPAPSGLPKPRKRWKRPRRRHRHKVQRLLRKKKRKSKGALTLRTFVASERSKTHPNLGCVFRTCEWGPTKLARRTCTSVPNRGKLRGLAIRALLLANTKDLSTDQHQNADGGRRLIGA